jgi:protein-L-isoaspartate(D-aspartate) O-methyltransferase
MFNNTELGIVRAAYAKQVMAAAETADARIEAAFAQVPREAYLGAGPWPIARHFGVYALSPSADPVYLYTDDLVALLPERGLNNGQPSFHAHMLAAAAPKAGEHAVHIGTGTGYYTAIIAALVRESGRVTGIEVDADLAERARRNFATQPHVEIVTDDGATAPFDAADVIYVNAGATRPADHWLDRLADGGRMILPLTTSRGFTMPTSATDLATRGAVFLIQRRGEDFFARWISPVAVFPCAGARDEDCERALAAALGTGRWNDVTRLYRHAGIADENAFLKGTNWSLAYA